ncbi:MAG: helix-turn-helix domain-containing protein [Desulfurococcales archaeon]|nr:helix-turn-helix domain-containing protein [Desulfurococcales archaeon]
MNNKRVRAIVEITHCYLGKLLKTSQRVRLLLLRAHEASDTLNVWVVVKGAKKEIRDFLKTLASEKGARYTILHDAGTSKLVHIVFPSIACPFRSKCPLASPSSKAIAVSTVIGEGKAVSVIIVSSIKALEELSGKGVRVLDYVEGDRLYEELTPQQEELLILAYQIGYYSYPRRASLKDLARILGLSVSTVAEKLRKAEAKIIGRVVKDELCIMKCLSEERCSC